MSGLLSESLYRRILRVLEWAEKQMRTLPPSTTRTPPAKPDFDLRYGKLMEELKSKGHAKVKIHRAKRIDVLEPPEGEDLEWQSTIESSGDPSDDISLAYDLFLASGKKLPEETWVVIGIQPEGGFWVVLNWEGCSVADDEEEEPPPEEEE